MFRKQDHHTLYEPFRVVPDVEEGARQKIICSYPELAIKISNDVFDDGNFRYGLANFHYCFNEAESQRDRFGWQDGGDGLGYSTERLTGIMRSIGSIVGVTRITKGVGHQAAEYKFAFFRGRYDDTPRPYARETSWGRSSVWLLVKVAIQLSLDRSPHGHATYKAFVLFLLCCLANHAVKTGLSSDRLHLMLAKVFRRLRKLAPSVPRWLSDATLQTCTDLRRTLHDRWIHMEIACSSSLPWNPSQLDLSRDTHLPLCVLHDYIINSLGSPVRKCLYIPFLPSRHLRGDLNDFLSLETMFFDDAYRDHPHIALYDVERVVEQGIDDWVACAPDVNKACVQLGILAEKYMSNTRRIYDGSPECLSVMVLTMIEFWIALDKLVVKESPILADYSPEGLLVLLERLLLRDATSLHRLCRAYHYISCRNKQAQPGCLVFSDELKYENTPHVLRHDSSPLSQHSRLYDEDAPITKLGTEVAFESNCPVFFGIWRSVTVRLVRFFYFRSTDKDSSRSSTTSPLGKPIVDIPELQPHPVGHQRVLISFRGGVPRGLEQLTHELPSGPYANSRTQHYLENTTHTPNEVLSAQVSCHEDLSLHEFISFGHLRSGGSLQWINILRELRSRTLNFRRPEVHLLFTQACTQVGPLGDNGSLVWHQELQDASFCCALLDELESLFVDVGAGSSDGPVMATVSLLACLLASSAGGDIAERAIALLRNVRGKTFDWVHELLCDWIDSPANGECSDLLRDMAAVCRSTFDVGPAMAHKLLHSAQDIEVALSCAILVRTTIPRDGVDFSGVLILQVLLTTLLI